MSPKFFWITRWMIAWFLLSGIFHHLGHSQEAAPVPQKYERPVVIHINGPISGLTEAFFRRAMDRARKIKADLIIVEIDSPGGELEASLFIAHTLRDVDFARTVAFVPDEAISGGAIIALGCDEIWPSEFGQIGDAGPIMFGADMQFRHAPEKIRSYLVQQVRQLAEAKNRPPALAEAMVDMNTTVHRVIRTSDGSDWYLNDAELAALADPKAFDKKEPVLEARPDTFLTVGGARAVELKLATGLAENRDVLLDALVSAKPLEELRPHWVDRTVYILNSPLVTALLLVIGLVALYFEFSMPGLGIGGIVSIICFGIFFWSHFLGGTAGWLEVLLFLIGFVLLITEVFVLPGFGIAGFSGIVMIIVALTMALQDFGMPRDPQQWQQTTRSLILVLTTFACVISAVVVLIRYAKVVPALRGLTLEPPTAADVASGTTLLSHEGSTSESIMASLPAVGDQGISESVLRPAGKARFHDRIVDVMSEGDFIDPHTPVVVVKRQSQMVVVRRV
jgi:membrane-bound serine protease (ClpP class)